MRSVYIETTIPSYYYETRQSPLVLAWQRVTREWWERHRHNYQLFTSQYVLAELAGAPEPKATLTRNLLKDVPLLGSPSGLEEVVEYYIGHRLMPVGVAGDAFHLALASMCGLDYLLTWNCRHLANANKRQHLGVINARLRLSVPEVITPMTLLPEDSP